MPSNKGDNYKVSHILENPVNVICEQLRYRSDCTFAQADHHLCCSPSRLLYFYTTCIAECSDSVGSRGLDWEYKGCLVCLICFFTSHQQSFSDKGTGHPWLNQY